MNKATRKTLDAHIDKLNAVTAILQSTMEDVNEIKESVEDLASEEQEKFDNMPEGLQNGSTGQSVQDAATALESVIDNLSEAINAIEQAVDDAINAIM